MSFTKNCIVTGKIILENPRAAYDMKKSYTKRFGSKMDVYKCEHCKGWHIGHKRGYKRKPGKW